MNVMFFEMDIRNYFSKKELKGPSIAKYDHEPCNTLSPEDRHQPHAGPLKRWRRYSLTRHCATALLCVVSGDNALH